jgi:MFS transporter, PPP family, 3-phenylpropionic acid transporter
VQAAWSVHLLFLPIYMSNQGAPEGLVGTAFSIGALAEVPIFFLIGRIAKRTGPLPPLVGAVLIQVTLYVLMSLSPSPYQMVAINTLSGVYFATYYPTIVTLVGALTPESLKATGQGLLAAFTWGLGNMAGTVIGGRVADLFGIPALYGYLVYVAVVGAAGYSLLWLILRRKVTQERRAS